jgi:hypothetical protein
VRRHAGAASAGSIDRRHRHFGAGVLATLAVSAALLLAVGAPVASAAPEAGPGWAYKANFGGFEYFGFDTFRTPVAVDGGGNVFGSDENQGVIRIYSPSPDGGTLLTEVSAGARNIAVDPSDGSIYADGSFGGPIRRFVSDGAPTPTYTLDPAFGEIPVGEGLAVDPTTGNLLVADPGAEGVRRYGTSGTLLETIATPSINPAWIVTAPDGSFYVAPAGGPDVTHFSGAGSLLGTITGVGSLHGLAYDATRSAVVVAVGDKLQAYSPTGALLAESPAQGGGGIGLAVGPSGSLYEHVGGSINYYALGTMPGVEAPHVSAIAINSAQVSAEVDPGAGPPEGSVAHFEYSADGGLTWPDEFKTADVPVERTVTEEPDTVEADLTGLKGNTGYLVRLVAGNSVMTTTSSSTPFHTTLGPPEVETGPAISITETAAELTGSIDTLGDQTTYRFEYGLTTSYGSKVPVGTEATAGSERSTRTFAREVSDLQPNTTYHYRIVAENSAGEAAGADRKFTTSGAAAVRAYEQVSTRNKMGGAINYRQGFLAAADGSGVVYQLGAAPENASSAPLFTRVLSRRASTDWLDWKSLDPPFNAQKTVLTSTTQAISADFTQAMVVSNLALAPGGIEDGGNIYIEDVETGDYTFVGGAPGSDAFNSMAALGYFHTVYMEAAPDFSWIVFNSLTPLAPGVTGSAMYKWSRDGGLEVVSRLPDDSIASSIQVPGPYLQKIRAVSEDGDTVYFNGDGIYRRSGGLTTAVSVSQIPGDPDTPQPGILDGISKDGRYAFFRTFWRLTSDTPSEPQASVYRYDAQDGSLEYVGAAFDASENHGWGVSDDGQATYFSNGSGTYAWKEGVTHQVTSATDFARSGVQVYSSPNSRYMAYRVVADATVHLYDAEQEEDFCVSCGPGDDSGETPAGVRTINNQGPEVVNDQGEMFFETANPLLADDHNTAYDVYMYRDGQLTLISPGKGPYNARFGTATPDGSDVFFTTEEALVPGDVDRNVDVYDARIGGGFSEAGVTRPECEGEACRPPIGRPPALKSSKGGESAGQPKFAISNLRPLSSADRKKLARGGTARLRLSVSRPGAVTVTGKKVDGSSVKAKKAGAIGVPFSLTKSALGELRDKRKLRVKLSVRFGDASPKVVHLTLDAVAPKKGGRS